MLKIAEIFYSLQMEGANTGKPAIFIRLAGCNMKCSFCDTDFAMTEQLTEDKILERVVAIGGLCRFVVLTGGEPLLQNLSKLTHLLFKNGYFIAMETNGTMKKPSLLPIQWLTVSPKASPIVQDYGDELKVVYEGQDLSQYPRSNFRHLYLQPKFTNDEKTTKQNIQKTVDAVKENPQWLLSLQAHKLIQIP